jgi:hypothetical protein
MTDIPKVMLDRACEAFEATIGEPVHPVRFVAKKVMEAAIRAALQPLPMESAPKDKEIDVFQRMDNGMTARWTNVIWIRDGWLWCGAVDSVYLRAEDLIGWFPIIGVGND